MAGAGGRPVRVLIVGPRRPDYRVLHRGGRRPESLDDIGRESRIGGSGAVYRQGIHSRGLRVRRGQGSLSCSSTRTEARPRSVKRISPSAAVEAGLPAPKIWETLTVNGRPGIVMERVEGPTMMRWGTTFPWRNLHGREDDGASSRGGTFQDRRRHSRPA